MRVSKTVQPGEFFIANFCKLFSTGWTLTGSRLLRPRVKWQRSTSNALPMQQRFGVVFHFVHASARARLGSFLYCDKPLK